MVKTMVPCPDCLDEFPVPVRVGEFDGDLLPFQLHRADLLAAYLEHTQEKIRNARPE